MFSIERSWESQASAFKQNYMYLNLCLDFQLRTFRFSATQRMLGNHSICQMDIASSVILILCIIQLYFWLVFMVFFLLLFLYSLSLKNLSHHLTISVVQTFKI